MTYTEVIMKLEALCSNMNGFSYIEYLRLVYSNVWTGLMYSFCAFAALAGVVVTINTIVYFVKQWSYKLVMEN